MKFTGERFIPGLCDEELTSEHMNRYRFAADLIKGLRVLDIACGAGYGTMILHESAACVNGVDISAEAIAYCRETYKDDAVHFHVGSVDAIPMPDQSVDAVVSFETLEHVSAQTQLAFMREIRRVLAPGGLLVISTPNKEIYDERGKNDFHVHELEADDFSALLRKNFHYVEVYGQISEICNLIVTDQTDYSLVSEGPNIHNCEYLVAVCSDKALPPAPQTVQPRRDNPLRKLRSWAIENNQRVEELSAWGKGLDAQVAERDATIHELNQRTEELSAWGKGLDAQVAERDTTIHELNLRTEELSAWGKGLDAQVAERDATIHELNQRTEELSAWGKGLDEQVAERDATIHELNQRTEELSAWGKRLDAQVAERDAIIHELNQRTEELSALGKGLDEQVAERDATIHELSQRTEELSAWGKNLDKQVAERDAIIHELNQRTEELSALGKGLDEQVAERDATIVKLNKHTEELSAWGRSLDEQIVSMTQERELAISKQRELEEQMRERDDILNQMMEKADLYNAWGTRLEEEIRKANAMAETVNAQREAIRQLEARYQGEILSYKELIEAQKTEIQHHKGHVEALEHVVDARNEQIESQKAEIRHHKGHVEALEHVVDVRNETIAALEGEKVQLNNQISYLQTKQDALMQREALLHEIEGSKAYRVTRMMQKVSAVVLPVGSRRRHAIGKALRCARHPFRSVSDRRSSQPVISTSEKLSDYKPLVFPVFAKPRVSIVIPVYNQFGYTYNCLKSILDHTKDVPYEVILGNDCSTDLTSKIKKIISNIQVVTHKKNLRFLLNCNRAAESVRGEFIYFLNNDTQVHPNWLSSLVDLMDRDHSIGMCGSKLVYANGQLQEAGGIIWKDGSAWNYGRLQDPDAPEYSYVKDVDYISGAAIMIRTSLWKEIGGFDERYTPAYNEDSDLAFEVRKHGKRVVLQPDSVITHFEGISNGTDTSSGQKAYQVTNVQKFCEKWKEVLEREHFNNAENVFQARDRSSHKKTILVVDHYVPQFDKDAGSRTVFAYLKLFVQKGLNVKFIGDNFYRHEPYTHVLQQMGVEVLYGPWYAQHWDEWLRENGSHIDYVMLNRPHISVKYIASVRLFTNAKIFYYGHDLHFLRERRRYETTKDPSALAASNEWVEKEKSLMLQADETWYPSDVEVEEIHRIDPKIRVRSIPAYLFESSDPVPYDAAKRQHVMFVGGFAHGPNVDAVKWLHDEIWPLVHQQCPSVKIYIIGSNPPDEIKRMNSKTFVVTGAVSDEELASYYHQCRMAIVPLRFGAGIKGKVVEAMYHRLPILTTKVGAEGISFTENSIAVRDQAPAFAGKLVKLYRDADTLNDMSAKYDQFIQNTYSYEFAAQTLAPEFDGWSAE